MPDRVTRRLAADPAGIAAAGKLLREGGLVAFPTETVYGLGADATNGEAVAGIYEAKGRPRFNPLIIHVAHIDDAEKLAVFSPLAEQIALKCWPGPLTLVLPKRAHAPISELALAGLSSIAVRIPSSQTARAIIASSGRPIAAPSANRSGHVSPSLAEHVLDDLEGRIDAVVMGEAADVGVESTILSLLDDRAVLLRPGGVTRTDLAAILGYEPDVMHEPDDESAPLAPGLLKSHYAPQARVRLDAETIQASEAAMLFGSFRPKGLETAKLSINLSPEAISKRRPRRFFPRFESLINRGPPSLPLPYSRFRIGGSAAGSARACSSPSNLSALLDFGSCSFERAHPISLKSVFSCKAANEPRRLG